MWWASTQATASSFALQRQSVLPTQHSHGRTWTSKGRSDAQPVPCGPGFTGHHTLAASRSTAPSLKRLSASTQPSMQSLHTKCCPDGHRVPRRMLTSAQQTAHSRAAAAASSCSESVCSRDIVASSAVRSSSSCISAASLHAKRCPLQRCLTVHDSLCIIRHGCFTVLAARWSFWPDHGSHMIKAYMCADRGTGEPSARAQASLGRMQKA